MSKDINVLEREMAAKGFARVWWPGVRHEIMVAQLAARGVKLVRKGGVTWAPKESMSFSLRNLMPADVAHWTKAAVLAYAKERGLQVWEHDVVGHRGGKTKRVNIGAGTGTSYRSALVDLLGFEESERWTNAAKTLGLTPPEPPRRKPS